MNSLITIRNPIVIAISKRKITVKSLNAEIPSFLQNFKRRLAFVSVTRYQTKIAKRILVITAGIIKG